MQKHNTAEGYERPESIGVRGETLEVMVPYALSKNFSAGIDLPGTGRRLEELIKRNGYSVKRIQKLLHLSCPQPIYRWMKGQALPTVDHLYILAKLFRMHMEEMLVWYCIDREEVIFSGNLLWKQRICLYSILTGMFG